MFMVVLLLAVVAAAPQRPQNLEVQILRQISENNGLGSYEFSYEQSDGTKREERGELINPGTEDEYLSVRGYFSWLDLEGKSHYISYIADKNGYQPIIDGNQNSGFEESIPDALPAAAVASLLG